MDLSTFRWLLGEEGAAVRLVIVSVIISMTALLASEILAARISRRVAGL